MAGAEAEAGASGHRFLSIRPRLLFGDERANCIVFSPPFVSTQRMGHPRRLKTGRTGHRLEIGATRWQMHLAMPKIRAWICGQWW